ncbi:DUF2269 family protein [Aminobacter niigataensis]|uniref:DUF2269 family protein n=1 Tax=Aminobacter niigataensis TaxID=83265 RepID=UPI00298EE057|nr:DUF2269 family protein [Aminobacter niigataensis]
MKQLLPLSENRIGKVWNMDLYSLFKLLHIVAAVVWAGGGFALMLLAFRADRAGNVEGMLQAMGSIGQLGKRLFVPASLATLVFGLIMCTFWVGFRDLWVVIGLAGYATTFLVGTLIFQPTGDRMAAMIARDGVTPAALDQGRRILKVARFDYAVMFIIVADMVLKPTLSDVPVLSAMAVLFVAGAWAAFGSQRGVAVPAA